MQKQQLTLVNPIISGDKMGNVVYEDDPFHEVDCGFPITLGDRFILDPLGERVCYKEMSETSPNSLDWAHHINTSLIKGACKQYGLQIGS